MKRGILKTFNVGCGDCITLLLKEGDIEFHIMIDCGGFTQDVERYVTETFHKHLDLLVISHVDNDHICGVVSMLSAVPDLRIDKILYNCYQRQPNQRTEIPESIKRNIEVLYKDLQPIIDVIEYKINVASSVTLAEKILTNEQWKNAWVREYITKVHDNISLSKGNLTFGRLVFLSPTEEILKELDKKYVKLFFTKLYVKRDDTISYDKEESIYELLIRLGQQLEKYDEQKIKYQSIDKQTLRALAKEDVKDITIENKASIAFVCELGEKKILFLGDSSPSIVAQSIMEKYGERIKFDFVKVSHHGSSHSTSMVLMDVVDSEFFIFTGGSASKRPSLPAIARIVTADKMENVETRHLYFNIENLNVKKLKALSGEVKEEMGFDVNIGNNEYVFEF